MKFGILQNKKKRKKKKKQKISSMDIDVCTEREFMPAQLFQTVISLFRGNEDKHVHFSCLQATDKKRPLSLKKVI